MSLSVRQENNGPYIVDDGTTLHAYTDAAAMRLFVETYHAIVATYPGVVFALADDATVVEWHRPGPRPDFAQARADYQAARDQEAADAAALRSRVRILAQSAVGVQIDALSAPQVRALIAVLLHKAGAIDASGGIRPLTEWG